MSLGFFTNIQILSAGATLTSLDPLTPPSGLKVPTVGSGLPQGHWLWRASLCPRLRSGDLGWEPPLCIFSCAGLVTVLSPRSAVDGRKGLLGISLCPMLLVAELVGTGFESGSPEVTAPLLSGAFPSPYLIYSQLQPTPLPFPGSTWVSKSTMRQTGQAGPGMQLSSLKPEFLGCRLLEHFRWRLHGFLEQAGSSLGVLLLGYPSLHPVLCSAG